MVIIVGLGNFGKQYDWTYHNLGFILADRFAEKIGVSFDNEKYKALVAEGTVDGQKVLIAKPLTYMNNSGQSVALLRRKFADARIIVLVDDVDIPAGTVRYRESGSSGTHNGLRSIVSFVGENFERLRIGTGGQKYDDLADFVLSKIEDKQLFNKVIDDAVDKLEKIITKKD